MNPTPLPPAARALIIEAATREAHAWTFALAAAVLAAAFLVLWLQAELRSRRERSSASGTRSGSHAILPALPRGAARNSSAFDLNQENSHASA